MHISLICLFFKQKNIFCVVVQATEALRVSLDDIRFVETKGSNYVAENLVITLNL